MEKELEQQIAAYMTEELAKGTGLSELQNLVNEKFGQHLTYMEIRIIASGLQVDWNANDPKAAAAKEKAKREEEAKKAEAEAAEGAAKGTGKTTVTVNKINPPGTVASGTVTFASGSTADWYVDQTGRPGIDNLKGNPPTREEAQAFMMELQKVLG